MTPTRARNEPGSGRERLPHGEQLVRRGTSNLFAHAFLHAVDPQRSSRGGGTQAEGGRKGKGGEGRASSVMARVPPGLLVAVACCPRKGAVQWQPQVLFPGPVADYLFRYSPWPGASAAGLFACRPAAWPGLPGVPPVSAQRGHLSAAGAGSAAAAMRLAWAWAHCV